MSDHIKADDVTTGERMVLVPASTLERLAADAGSIAWQAERGLDSRIYWDAAALMHALRDLAGKP